MQISGNSAVRRFQTHPSVSEVRLNTVPSFWFCPRVGEPRGILGKESSKPVPVKKPLHRSVSFTEPEHQPKVEKQIGRCKSAATLETMAGAGSEPENLSGKCLTMLLPCFQSHKSV